MRSQAASVILIALLDLAESLLYFVLHTYIAPYNVNLSGCRLYARWFDDAQGHFPLCILNDAWTPLPALISSSALASLFLPVIAISTTLSTISFGTQTTPSSSATIQSPVSTLTAGNASEPCGSITSGTFTADGRTKGDWPKVECPRANTGKPAARCSSTSLHRPDITTPTASRACAPAVMRPPQTAFFTPVPVLTSNEPSCAVRQSKKEGERKKGHGNWSQFERSEIERTTGTN
jgi:hypothetical protein